MNISLRYTFGSVWSVGRSVVYTLSLSSSHHRCIEIYVQSEVKIENRIENREQTRKFSPFFSNPQWSQKKNPENKRFICVFKREIGKSERNLVNPSVLHFFPGVTANDWIKRVFKHTNFLVDFFSSRLKTWIVYANNKRRYCIVNEIKNQNWFVFRGV